MNILIFILLITLIIIVLHNYYKSNTIISNNIFCNGIGHNDFIAEWLYILNIANNIKLFTNDFKIKLKNNIKIEIILSLKKIIMALDNLSNNLNNFLEKILNPKIFVQMIFV